MAAFWRLNVHRCVARWLPVRAQVYATYYRELPSPRSLNFISWVLYALQNGDGNLLRVNVIGCGFMVLYLGIFLTYTRGSAWYKLVGMLTAGCVLGGAVESSIIYLEGNKDTRITLLGAVAVACNVVMYLAPIKSIATAYKDMDPEVRIQFSSWLARAHRS